MSNEGNGKSVIKKYMVEKGYSLRELSKKSNINILNITYLVFVPFSRIKLTQALSVTKVLGIKVSDLF
jgi:hypothetical protein